MLYGAIIGDICGSVYEGTEEKGIFPDKLFEEGATFTDDTVCTMAIAHAVLTDGDYEQALRTFGNLYPTRWYGPMFCNWLMNPKMGPYNSFGNGSAMRVSPIGYISDDEKVILEEAAKSANPTHNHPEGIKGAQAVAYAIYLARTGHSKREILDILEGPMFGYPLLPIEDIRKDNDFTMTCQKSIPSVMSIFNKANDFEECIKLAISLGGDTDTNAAIVGSIAEAYYGISDELRVTCNSFLPDHFLNIIFEFEAKFASPIVKGGYENE